MPSRKQVEKSLLRVLLRHDGVIKEFGEGQEIVETLANEFELNDRQRSAFLETTYRKENRLKRSLLWHRLLFRAADSLAKEKLVSRPTHTILLTGEREWMLTEMGLDYALKLCGIPTTRKAALPTKSFEVEKIVKEITNSPPGGDDYNPCDNGKRIVKMTSKSVLRNRAFRQAVIEAYKCRCAVCGLQIQSPDLLSWEVEAAHIVPNHAFGKDDVCNGIALCHLHHWAFDVGWFTVLDDFKIQRSQPSNRGRFDSANLVKLLTENAGRIDLPERREIHPHPNALHWHRKHVFHKEVNYV